MTTNENLPLCIKNKTYLFVTLKLPLCNSLHKGRPSVHKVIMAITRVFEQGFWLYFFYWKEESKLYPLVLYFSKNDLSLRNNVLLKIEGDAEVGFWS